MNVKKIRFLVKKTKLTSTELKDVEKFLREASEAYYNTDEKILSDSEYDYLYERYVTLGGKPFVGAKPSIDESNPDSRIVDTEHRYPKLVGTTHKSHNLMEAYEWLEKTFKRLGLNPRKDSLNLVITLKFDGNSILIEYDEDGKVSRALTRGENGKGKDLTKVFNKGFDLNMDLGRPFAIKYECLLKYSALPRIERKFGKSYKNPRNGVSGMLNGNDAVKYRKYYTLEPLWMDIDPQYKEDFIEEYKHGYSSFRELELSLFNDYLPDSDTYNYSYELDGNFKELCGYIEEVHDEVLAMRSDLDFMIDGLVIDVMDDDYRTTLGYIEGSENPEPRWCTALKFPYMEMESEVTFIDYSVGDSGRISPVCHFKPVTMANGTTHEKQYLQGYKRFKELELCVGTRILVQLHNDTLSYIERLDRKEDDKKEGRTPIEFVKYCPCCGEPLTIQENEDGDETFVYCTNEFCTGRIVGKINNYFDKMGIKGIKTKTIERLHYEGIWNTIEDVYSFDIDRAYDIDGLGEKSINQIVKAIEKKQYYDYEILGSLGIRNFGLDKSKLLCSEFDFDDIMDFIGNLYESKSKFTYIREKIESHCGKLDDVDEHVHAEREYEELFKELVNDLCSINGIGKKLANGILLGVLDNYELVQFLMKRGYKKLSDDQDLDAVTYSFVITGDLSICGRDTMKKILERHGHKLIGSVSGKTDYLVTNFPNSGTTKIAKAKELGKPIINEKEFLELLGYDMETELKAVKQAY